MDANVIRAGILALCWGLSHSVAAESDPTRPPSVAGESRPAGQEAAGGPVLESVMIPARGKPVAVISGKTVVLGQKFGEDRLVRLTEREAVLRGKGGETRLALNPAVLVKPITGNTAGNKPSGRP